MDSQTDSKATAKRPIGITATYIIQGDDGETTRTSETFDASHSDASEVRVGLPIGFEPVKVRFDQEFKDNRMDQPSLSFTTNDWCSFASRFFVENQIFQAQPGDDAYSGMHDQGPLPAPKEGGPIAFLIGCTRLAKGHNDAFLTNCIQQEKSKQKEKLSTESPNTNAEKSSYVTEQIKKQKMNIVVR